MVTVPREALIFLKNLAENYNREWFNARKDEFLEINEEMKSFYAEVVGQLNQEDHIVKTRVYRIYRDIRFSKDKTPYKKFLAAHFARKKPELRGGYYLKIQPGGESRISVEFRNPVKEDLYRVRKEWETDAGEMRSILAAPDFKEVWGEMLGEQLKTAPHDFDKNNPDIDLINYKQWVFRRYFKDEEVLASDFVKKVVDSYSAARPFFDYMSEILTTDLNGESLL